MLQVQTSCVNEMNCVKNLLRFLCIQIVFMIPRTAAQCSEENFELKTLNSQEFTSRWSNDMLNGSCKNPADSIMDFLENQVNVLQFAKTDDIVFVFGAEHTNKTILVLFLTDAELEAVESSLGSFDFIDRDGPLNEYDSSIEPNIIPDLIPHKTRGIEFYVVPEHNITVPVRNDISGEHLMQRLLESVAGVKFVFTINFSSVKDGGESSFEEREEIRQLARNATDLIKDIKKYEQSMVLVVTGYRSYTEKDDEYDMIDVAKIAQSYERF